MIVNLNDVLKPAQKNHYAVRLFNAVNLEMTNAIMNTAERLNAPVIMGTAEILLGAADLAECAAMVKARAERSKVPVVLHYDHGLTGSIKKTVAGFPGVQGAYDLVLNNYGPDSWNGSVHIEVPDTYSAEQLDRLIRNIQEKVYEEYNVVLTAIGVYFVNTKDEDITIKAPICNSL